MRRRTQREATEQLSISLAYGAMSDLSNPNHNGSEPPRSRWVPLWVFALVLVATGGAVFLGNRREQDSPQVAAVQSKAGSLSSAQDETLEQTVKRAADQISDLRRQLSAEQAEQKLLSERIGALAARVDSLERAHTQTTGSMKRRGGAR